MIKHTILPLATFILLTAAPLRADDSNGVAQLFSQVCANCHGPTGKGMASFPRLAGRDSDYITSRLKQYRAGEMVGANTPLMRPHAVNLTDEEIAAYAEYIATTLSSK